MKKSYIVIAVLAAVTLSISYYFHHGKVVEARTQIGQKNKLATDKFIAEKEASFQQFETDFPNHQNIIEDYYSKNDATVMEDTTVNTFVFFSSITVTRYDDNYLNCLTKKAGFEVDKLQAEEQVAKELRKLVNRYGSEVESWLDKIGKETFLNTSTRTSYCTKFFTTYQDYSLNQTALIEFQDLILKFRADRASSSSASSKIEQEFLNDLYTVRNRLNRDGESYLNNHLERDEIIESTNRDYVFEGEIIGIHNYSFPTKVYHRAKLETLVKKAMKEQYKNNSLKHGSKPYAYCFGSYNGCDGYNCSQVEVQVSHNSDVLVTLKKNDRVVRHSYILAGRTYTFKVPNGRYQPFFYSGTGWNPHKQMKETACGTLKGGFVTGGHVGKDSPQNLDNNILKYELIEQIDGNFQTRPSSTDEAF